MQKSELLFQQGLDGDTNPDRVGCCSVASGCQRRALTESVSGTRQRQAGKHGELIKPRDWLV